MIERMPKGWPYERLRSRDSSGRGGDNFFLAAGVFAVTVMVGAMALAVIGAW